MIDQDQRATCSQGKAKSSLGARFLCRLVKALKLPSAPVMAVLHNDTAEPDRPSGDDAIHRDRYRLLSKHRFSIELHRITGQAAQQFHNHPWPALSIVLTGCYRERYFDADLQQRERKVRWLNRVSPSRFHMLVDAKPDTWLLLIAGKQTQGRGFITSLENDQASYVVPVPFDEDAGCEPGQHVI